jgi:hypothetical protein
MCVRVDAALITAVAPTSGTVGVNIATVTLTCATTGCQGDGAYLMASFAPTTFCGTAARREDATLVTTGAKTVVNVVLRSNQAYKVCWFVMMPHSGYPTSTAPP